MLYFTTVIISKASTVHSCTTVSFIGINIKYVSYKTRWNSTGCCQQLCICLLWPCTFWPENIISTSMNPNTSVTKT